MIEFDFTPGQKAFVMGLWGGSLLLTLAVLVFDAARSLAKKVIR